jgi:molybdenum cofactor cytidylyltransferase
MDLIHALRLKNPINLAAVGAGGKSSLLFALARQCPGKVIVTTTTHLLIGQIKLADLHFTDKEEALLEKIRTSPKEAVIVITGSNFQIERVNGPSADDLDKIHQLCVKEGYSLLIEADGSRKMPLKAYAEHEPVIPEWVDTVVHVVGCSVIGKPLQEGNVYGSERLAEIGGAQVSEPIQVESICTYLGSPKGGLKGLPAHSRSILFFNQLDELSSTYLECLKSHVSELLEKHHCVMLGALHGLPHVNGEIKYSYERIAAVVLAAGESKRFGFAKQLLQNQGISYLKQTVQKAMKCGLSPIFVILGYQIERMQQELAGLPVTILPNPDWSNGQSTSVKVAVAQLLELNHYGGALFLTIDQPFLTPHTMKDIIDSHSTSVGTTIVPRCDGQSGSPVLFDADHLHEMMGISGDQGGRAILHQVDFRYQDIQDCKELKDIDTVEQYRKYFPDETDVF